MLEERSGNEELAKKLISSVRPVTSLSTNQIEGPALSPSARLPGVLEASCLGGWQSRPWFWLLAFLSLYPLSMLLYGSLHTTPPGIPGTFDLSGYRAGVHLANGHAVRQHGGHFPDQDGHCPCARRPLWMDYRANQYAGAWGAGSADHLAFFVPPILTAMAWGMLGNPQVGVVNLVWRWITGSADPLVNIYSYGGVIWHMLQYSDAVPVPVHRRGVPFDGSGAGRGERMCGASQWRTFRRVTFALMMRPS